MKRLCVFLLICLYHTMAIAQKNVDNRFLTTSVRPNTESLSIPVVAKTISAKIMYDVVEDNEKGIKIWPKLQIDNLGNSKITLTTSFYLPSGTPKYSTSLTITANPATDPYFFIPYTKLNLAANKVHKLKFDITAYANGKALKSSVFYNSIINLL